MDTVSTCGASSNLPKARELCRVNLSSPRLWQPSHSHGRLRGARYLAVVAASLAFLAGWLTVNGAVVLTVALLSTLIVLSWVHLRQGRHPCFLFFVHADAFQGGRLIAYCLGAEPDPMRAVLLDSNFDLSRVEQRITLLCLAISANCVYAPCRCTFRPIPPPELQSVRKWLPFL